MKIKLANTWMFIAQVALCLSAEIFTRSKEGGDKDVVLLTGGYTSSQTLEVFDQSLPGQPRCSPSLTPPKNEYGWTAHLFGHTSHYIDDKVLICGGRGNEHLCYLLDDKKFRVHSQLQKERSYHAGAILNGKLSLIGGYENSMETLAGISWSLNYGGQPMAHKVSKSCVVTLDNNQALFIGGKDFDNFALVSLYNGNWGWTTKTSLPEKRTRHSCITLRSGEVMVAGGFGDYGKSMDTVFTYSLAKNSWKELPGKLNTARGGGQMVKLDARILYFGGCAGDRFETCNTLNTVEEFDEATGEWNILDQTMETPRKYFSAVAVPASAVGCQQTPQLPQTPKLPLVPEVQPVEVFKGKADIAFILRGYNGETLFPTIQSFRPHALDIMRKISHLSFENVKSFQIFDGEVDQESGSSRNTVHSFIKSMYLPSNLIPSNFRVLGIIFSSRQDFTFSAAANTCKHYGLKGAGNSQCFYADAWIIQDESWINIFGEDNVHENFKNTVVHEMVHAVGHGGHDRAEPPFHLLYSIMKNQSHGYPMWNRIYIQHWLDESIITTDFRELSDTKYAGFNPEKDKTKKYLLKLGPESDFDCEDQFRENKKCHQYQEIYNGSWVQYKTRCYTENGDSYFKGDCVKFVPLNDPRDNTPPVIKKFSSESDFEVIICEDKQEVVIEFSEIVSFGYGEIQWQRKKDGLTYGHKLYYFSNPADQPFAGGLVRVEENFFIFTLDEEIYADQEYIFTLTENSITDRSGNGMDHTKQYSFRRKGWGLNCPKSAKNSS